VRLARRDRTALAELYDACSGRAFGLAYRVTGDGPAAEDVVHDAFLWMWEHGDRVDATRGSPEALLLTVTHRRAIDYVRKRSRQDARRPGGEVFPDAIDEQALALLAEVDEAEVRERVLVALEGLNPEQREAVDLAFFQGMTHQQIAAARSLPVGTVKSRLRLAMGRLRAALREEDSS
jgi:RNA polymerase sigma-70 factor (ECF subfamily)